MLKEVCTIKIYKNGCWSSTLWATLKASSVSESINSGARAFQSLTVLGKKDIFLLSVLQGI